MEDYKLRDLRYAPHTHWVGRGTGNPKDKDEVDKSCGILFSRKRHGGGIKGLDDKSSGMEILMTETFAKIKPTDPLILDRHTTRRKRKLFIMNR